jgi:hypothetical protein
MIFPDFRKYDALDSIGQGAAAITPARLRSASDLFFDEPE